MENFNNYNDITISLKQSPKNNNNQAHPIHEINNLDKDFEININSDSDRSPNKKALHITIPIPKNSKSQIHDKNISPKVKTTKKSSSPRLTIQEAITEDQIKPIKSMLEEEKMYNEQISRNSISGITKYKNPVNYEFYHGDISSKENQDFYINYLSKINDDQKDAFKIANDFKSFNIGITPRIIFIYDSQGSVIGMSQFGYDSTGENLKLNFNHFSTILFDDYEKVLEGLKDFVSDNLIFEEINVNIFYKNIVRLL